MEEKDAFIYQISPVGEMSPEGCYTSDQLFLPGGRTLTEYIIDTFAKKVD